MTLKRMGHWIATAFSTLIIIEVLIMISPFALYWYSFYSPTLQALHRSSWTAWTESFILPHAVVSSSAVLEFLRWNIAPYLASLGLLGFLAFAIQIYSAKLRKKSMVSGGIYRYVRHPQYLCLAVAGIGLLVRWPRMMILLFYLGMVVAYYLLARSEEGRMQQAHPGYAEYMQRTAMFFPGSPGKHLHRWLFAWMKNPNLETVAICVTILTGGLGMGIALREYTIAHVTRAPVPSRRTLAIAGWPEKASRMELAKLTEDVLRDPEIQARMQQEGDASFAAHLLPANYGMIDMFVNLSGRRERRSEMNLGRFRFVVRLFLPFLGRRGGRDRRYGPMGDPNQDQARLIVSRMGKPGQLSIPLDSVLDMSARMTPVAMVDVETATGRILKRYDPNRSSVWGPITMPIF